MTWAAFACTGGAQSDVYRGAYNEEMVCVKMPRFFGDKSDLVNLFLANSLSLPLTWCKRRIAFIEAVFWQELEHPNILPLIGVAWLGEASSRRLACITPWIVGGNILDYLEAHPGAD